MEHSMSVDGSIVSQADLRQMQDTIRKLEEDQQETHAQLYDLQKQKQQL